MIVSARKFVIQANVLSSKGAREDPQTVDFHHRIALVMMIPGYMDAPRIYGSNRVI